MIVALIIIAPCIANTDENAVKVVHFINGAQGEESFFDSAVRGIAGAESYFDIEVTTIEAGYNSSAWMELLEEAAAREDYDVLTVGSALMQDLLSDVAKMHPDKRFIIYDSSVDRAEGGYGNVYSVLYRAERGRRPLAGVYAGLMTESGIIGILGGQNSTTINDFVVGYQQGAKSVRPDVVVLIRYAETWNDAALGDEMATKMYGEGQPHPQLNDEERGCEPPSSAGAVNRRPIALRPGRNSGHQGGRRGFGTQQVHRGGHCRRR